MDGLSGLKICTAYQYRGKQLTVSPLGAEALTECEPIYETMPGWSDVTLGVQRIDDLPQAAKDYINRGMHVGEGWLLTAEMIELIHVGSPNIVCTQPFGCLPNHIAGKGMIKKIKETYPQSNIVAIDYDTSATEINQMNRIKLMVSNAKRNML